MWHHFGCAHIYVNDGSDDDRDNTKIIKSQTIHGSKNDYDKICKW